MFSKEKMLAALENARALLSSLREREEDAKKREKISKIIDLLREAEKWGENVF